MVEALDLFDGKIFVVITEVDAKLVDLALRYPIDTDPVRHPATVFGPDRSR